MDYKTLASFLRSPIMSLAMFNFVLWSLTKFTKFYEVLKLVFWLRPRLVWMCVCVSVCECVRVKSTVKRAQLLPYVFNCLGKRSEHLFHLLPQCHNNKRSLDSYFLASDHQTFVFDCFFTSDHQTFWGLSKVRQSVIRRLNHAALT